MKKYLAFAAGLLAAAGAVSAQNVPSGTGNDSVHTDNRPDNSYNVIANASAPVGSSAYAEKYQKALDDFKAGNLDQAAVGLQGIAKKATNDVTVHSLLGYIYLRQNKNPEAVSEMETVVKLAPRDDGAHKNLGSAYLRVGRYDDAAAQYQAVLSRSPKDVDALFGLAMAQGQAGHSDQAAETFRHVVAARPTSVAYQNFGVVLQKSGHYPEAADAFRKAADLEPKNAADWLYAGLLYSQTGASDKAVPALKQALALGTDSLYDAHMALAQIYARQKNNALALTEFGAAVQARPDDPAANFDLAVLQDQTEQKAAAEQAYRKVLALPSADASLKAQAHQALATLADKQGDAAKALTERQSALEITPQDDQTRLLVADGLLAGKKYAEAAKEYGIVALHQPSNASVQNALGTAYEQQGDLAQAQTAFEAALKADAKYAQAENNLGVIYEKQGRKAQAIAAYKQAVAIDPNLTEAKKNLARFAAK